MTDNKRKRGKADKSRVAGKQKYEVAYLVKKHKVPARIVRFLTILVGRNRKSVETAIRLYKKV